MSYCNVSIYFFAPSSHGLQFKLDSLLPSSLSLRFVTSPSSCPTLPSCCCLILRISPMIVSPQSRFGFSLRWPQTQPSLRLQSIWPQSFLPQSSQSSVWQRRAGPLQNQPVPQTQHSCSLACRGQTVSSQERHRTNRRPPFASFLAVPPAVGGRLALP